MALFDTSAFTGGFFTILSSLFFWLVAILVLVFFAFATLLIRRKKKLNVPIVEVIDIGGGKVSVKFGKKMRGGWFKHRTTFFGLWDYGKEEVFKLKDRRKVHDVSTGDYQDINGKPGLYIRRSPHDPRLLVPVSKIEVKNWALLESIAPASYREMAVNIVDEATRETRDSKEKVMQFVLMAGFIIFALVAIILITKMVSDGQTEAKDLILEAGNIAGKFDTQQLELLCRGLKTTGETVVSTTAP